MILKEYDIGWGPTWPAKQLEQQIVKKTLEQFYVDDTRSVIINSVWYTSDYHQRVMEELRSLRPTHVFVVALLDPPIVKLDWFEELDCQVVGVGYYPGDFFIDYFALFMNQFYRPVKQDLLNAAAIDKAYMCLNRKPHPHRLRLYQGLENSGVLDSGLVSMGGDEPKRLLNEDCEGQDIAPNAGRSQYGIANDVASLGNLNNWHRHFVNIITETIWDIESCNFISEKTYKPILGLRPFLIYAPNGGVTCLQDRGFEPYVDDFKDITDVDLRQPYNITVFLSELCQQPPSYWQMKFAQLKEKLLYNQQSFENHVSQQKNFLQHSVV